MDRLKSIVVGVDFSPGSAGASEKDAGAGQLWR